MMCHTCAQSLHAWVSAIGFGILVPAGIFISRELKEYDPFWFHLHYSIVLLGNLILLPSLLGHIVSCQIPNRDLLRLSWLQAA